jgi:hypothetical protein
MVTPWWYTKYYPVNSTDAAFYDANPGLDQHTGLFDMTNCFIDGSCITGGQIYKNNSTLQWVYTAVLVLMILGWIPWLLFVHLLHFRNSKNPYRANMRGLRPLMLLSALAAFLLILAAFIVFATGMVKTNGVYNSGGLYGHKSLLSQNGLIGTGGNVDDSNNKRSEPIAMKRTDPTYTGGVSGGTGPVLTNTDSTATTGPSTGDATATATGTGDATATATGTGDATATGTGITPPLGESGTATGSDSASATETGTGSSTTGFATGSTTSDVASTTTTPATSTDGAGIIDVIPNTFGYTGVQDARNLNLYWEPHAWGTLPYGNQGYNLLGAGIPVLYVSSVSDLNGTLGYKYGAHAAWYFTLLALALIPLALLLGLCIRPAKEVATQTRASTVRSTATVLPAVGAASAIPAVGSVGSAIPASVGTSSVIPPVYNGASRSVL